MTAEASVRAGTPDAPADVAPPEAVPARGYQAQIDGLRSIAVYLVVLFHAGVSRATGGYIGVDVFFVLSGFLVTRLLLRDLEGGGTVRFGRFYARRFRRLLPAAFVALVGTALVFVVVDPIEARASLDSFRAAFLYVANWFFIRESADYFGSAVAADPVLQFWSLAVEEQFYLLWPLVLAGLFALARRLPLRQRRPAVQFAVGAGAVASLAWALHLRTVDLNRAYFGTDARAYQLLAGASLALIPVVGARADRWRTAWRVAAPVGLLAIVAVGSSLGGGDAIVRGLAATIATAVAIVALDREDGGPASRLLSLPPLVYLGKVSYGTYLWHWPVILVLDRTLDLDPLQTAAVTIALATGLASLSFQVLENPVRASRALDRHRFVVIGAGLTISVVSALVVVPAIVERPISSAAGDEPGSAANAAATTGTPVPPDIDLAAVYETGYSDALGADGEELTCVGAPASQCTVVQGSGLHLLLIGDSTAQALTGGLIAMAEANDLTLSVAASSGCPWQRELYRLAPEIQQRCRSVKEDAYDRLLTELDPDVVVASVSYNAPEVDGPESIAFDEPVLDRATTESAAELTEGGRTLVIVESLPKPGPELNPLNCLTMWKALEPCRFLATSDPNPSEVISRRVDVESDLVHSIDLDRAVCPYFPICDPVLDGQVVRWDRQHLTVGFSRTLAVPLAATLRSRSVIP
jgi:peptidoglycan/LPS O-acetylase OafA/YrhL